MQKKHQGQAQNLNAGVEKTREDLNILKYKHIIYPLPKGMLQSPSH